MFFVHNRTILVIRGKRDDVNGLILLDLSQIKGQFGGEKNSQKIRKKSSL